jgi:ribosomal protein S18 acetylase RimI-like enzyme
MQEPVLRLAELARATYAQAFGHSFEGADLQAHLDAHLSDACVAQWVEETAVWVVEARGGLVGYVQCHASPRDGREWVLHRLYVRQEHQRQGLGTRLLETVLALPGMREAGRITLEVWEHNPGARKLYERYGFRVIGRREFPVASGLEASDELVMERVRRAFYPPDQPVPGQTRTGRLALRPLSASDVAPDYEAVMASAPMLRKWSRSPWPADDFTIAENLKDLERHEREHGLREAFTFTVLAPEGATCLGCVYLQPLPPPLWPLAAGAERPVQVGFWIRSDAQASGLETHLLEVLETWLDTEWAFDRFLFPATDRQAALLESAGMRCLGTVGPKPGWRVFARV